MNLKEGGRCGREDLEDGKVGRETLQLNYNLKNERKEKSVMSTEKGARGY